MNKVLKIAFMAGLLITILVFIGGCVAPAGGQAAEQNPNSTWIMIAFLVVIFALFYFVMIRPQRKRQKEQQTMVEGLKKGDRVITAGGIYGTIESVSEESVVIKVESGTTLRVNKGSVAVRREETRK
jgi:preprotein translocase subunit YajC